MRDDAHLGWFYKSGKPQTIISSTDYVECHIQLKANFYDLGTSRKWASFTKDSLRATDTHSQKQTWSS